MTTTPTSKTDQAGPTKLAFPSLSMAITVQGSHKEGHSRLNDSAGTWQDQEIGRVQEERRGMWASPPLDRGDTAGVCPDRQKAAGEEYHGNRPEPKPTQ